MLDLAAALVSQRDAVRGDRELLLRLREVVGAPASLTEPQWLQLYAFALELAPDLVVELGRGNGNSTCVFTQAVARLGRGRVVSVGFDTGRTWATRTAPQLRPLVGDAWFEPLEARHQDILSVDFPRLFGDAGRVLLFWDAHGRELGSFLLAEALPALVGREHAVAVHDVTDGRREDPGPAYLRPDGLPAFWQGELVSPFHELVPLYDFLSRNRLPYRTAAASLLDAEEPLRRELEAAYGDLGVEGLLDGGHWLCFALEPPPGRVLAFPGHRPSRLRRLRSRLAARGLSLVAPAAED